MTAKEFLENEGYRKSTEVEGDILNTKELEVLLKLFADIQNKELIEGIKLVTDFSLRKNAPEGDYDAGYNQALENLRDIINMETNFA